MARTGGTARIVALTGDWMTVPAIIAAVPDIKNAAQLVSSMVRQKRLHRRGKCRAYEYKADPAWAPKAIGGARPGAGRRKADSVTAARQIDVAAYEPAPDAQLSPSIGLVCAVTSPANPSQGRIEDAIASVLDEARPTHLADLLAAMPVGWSRAAIVSALTDGLLDGWVGSASGDSRVRYVLVAQPPVARADPLVKKFKTTHLQERLSAIETDLSDVLGVAREFGMNAKLATALINARSSVRRALRHIE